ncbi:MAG: efflux transporter outer membrane subunit [Nitrospiraceae bacterium]|nr:efflux transporter outer membrane subunit [Nitrospiraceae bacterium]
MKTFLGNIALPALACVVMTLTGCATVGPDYVRPDVSVPTQWNGDSCALTAGQLDTKKLSEWWTTLNDSELTNLIERAIQSNTDLRKAKSRVREARARRGISEAALFPSVNASGSVQHTHSRAQTGFVVDSNLPSTGSNATAESDLYSMGFDAGWEVDLFGGKRRAIEASHANLEASGEDLNDVLVSLIGEVASSYVDLRSFQTRLSIAEANRDAQQETYQIVQWRREAGLITDLDVDQAKYNMEQTKTQIPTLETGIEKAKNRLAVLLGLNPGSLEKELAERKSIPVASQEIAYGIPADVLRNRPDVRQAERKLAAETARIGVQTAEMYPKLNLSGSIGLEALSLSNLFNASSKVYSYGPSFKWNIFNAGSVRQNIEAQNAVQEQALITYEASILSALEEVNNALAAYAKERIRRQLLFEASQAAERAAGLAQNQYSSGLIDFQSVLDAQRSLLNFQGQLAESEAAVTSDLISLYKALGGGWQSIAPDKRKMEN